MRMPCLCDGNDVRFVGLRTVQRSMSSSGMKYIVCNGSKIHLVLIWVTVCDSVLCCAVHSCVVLCPVGTRSQSVPSRDVPSFLLEALPGSGGVTRLELRQIDEVHGREEARPLHVPLWS